MKILLFQMKFWILKIWMKFFLVLSQAANNQAIIIMLFCKISSLPLLTDKLLTEMERNVLSLTNQTTRIQTKMIFIQ
ncbi:hypothetical protein Barb6_03218 [Bacteroidales bacterium Barb6]|nr:hypothetical protein Barb6_03218 [Bacteroidales bacterium Barb6]